MSRIFSSNSLEVTLKLVFKVKCAVVVLHSKVLLYIWCSVSQTPLQIESGVDLKNKHEEGTSGTSTWPPLYFQSITDLWRKWGGRNRAPAADRQEDSVSRCCTQHSILSPHLWRGCQGLSKKKSRLGQEWAECTKAFKNKRETELWSLCEAVFQGNLKL